VGIGGLHDSKPIRRVNLYSPLTFA
jgi:hypothetical protein